MGERYVILRSIGPAVILIIVLVGVISMLLRIVESSPAGTPTSPSHLNVVLLSTRTNPAQPRFPAGLKSIELKSVSEAARARLTLVLVQNSGQISGALLSPSTTLVVFIQALKYGERTAKGT